jgi:hypothetical protein
MFWTRNNFPTSACKSGLGGTLLSKAQHEFLRLGHLATAVEDFGKLNSRPGSSGIVVGNQRKLTPSQCRDLPPWPRFEYTGQSHSPIGYHSA